MSPSTQVWQTAATSVASSERKNHTSWYSHPCRISACPTTLGQAI